MAPSGIYTTLIHAKSNIRLVVLSPGQSDETIQCHLRIVRLSRAGRYEALSYEWGSPNDDTPLINLNGKPCHVQKNLSRALKALRFESVEQTFWIDALCINQEDKIEKNHQVPLMGEIYRGAHLVRVWLGKSRYGSSEAIAFLQRLAGPDYGHHQRSANPWESLLGLCCRKYWTRIWIVQELLLARQGIVHCGDDQVSLSECTRAQAVLAEMVNSRGATRTIGGAPRTIRKIVQSPAMKLLQKRQRNNKSGIFELLDAFRQSQCSLRHDKLYGLLGLAKDVPTGSFITDYDLELFDVMVDLVLLYLKLRPQTPRSVSFLRNKVYDWIGYQKEEVEREVERMVKVVEEKRNESCWGSEIEESDDDGSEVERSDSGSISLHSHDPVHARGGLDFFTQLKREQPAIEMECDILVFYYRAERPLKSTVEKSTTSEDMVLKANLAGLEKIRSPYHLYLFLPERALFTSRMSPQHLKVNLASLEKIQSPYHPYLFRPERALFTSRMNPRVLASSRNVLSVESSSLV